MDEAGTSPASGWPQPEGPLFDPEQYAAPRAPADDMHSEATAPPAAGVQAYGAGGVPGPTSSGVQAGWYPDPADPAVQRYWNGQEWIGPALPAGVPAPPDQAAPAAAPDIPDGAIAVPLGEQVVHVLSPMAWPTRANQALTLGDFETWASYCLAPGEYDKIWSNLNDGDGPTLGDVVTMMDEFRRLTGQTAGKSRGQASLSRRIQRL